MGASLARCRHWRELAAVSPSIPRARLALKRLAHVGGIGEPHPRPLSAPERGAFRQRKRGGMRDRPLKDSRNSPQTTRNTQSTRNTQRPEERLTQLPFPI